MNLYILTLQEANESKDIWNAIVIALNSFNAKEMITELSVISCKQLGVAASNYTMPKIIVKWKIS